MLLVVVNSGHWVGIPAQWIITPPSTWGRMSFQEQSKLTSKFSHCDNDACATGIPNLDPDGAWGEETTSPGLRRMAVISNGHIEGAGSVPRSSHPC